MNTILSLAVMLALFGAGFRYRGAWITLVFISYQAASLANISWLGTAFVGAAGGLSMLTFAPKLPRLRILASDYIMLLLCVWLLCSALWSDDAAATIEGFVTLLTSVAGTFAIGRTVAEKPKEVVTELLLSLTLASVVLAFGLLGARASGTWAADHRLVIEGSDASVVGLTLSIPFAIVSSALVYLTFKRFSIRIMSLCSLCIIGYLAVATGTRSIFISAIMGMTVFLILGRRRNFFARNVWLVPVGVAALFLFADKMPWESVQAQLGRLTGNFANGQISIDSSAEGRILLYRKAEELIAENPFFGIGYNAFGLHAALPYPHNLFLEVAVSGGLVAFLLLIMLLFAHLKNIFLIMRSNDDVAMVIMVLTVVSVIQLQVSFPFSSAKPLFLLIFLGAALRNTIEFQNINHLGRKNMHFRNE